MAPPDIEVRPVRPEEHAEAGKVIVSAYMALSGHEAVLADGYAGELADVAARVAEAEVLVAVEAAPCLGTSVVGCVTLVTDPSSRWAELLEEGEAGIRMMGVRPDVQGRGIGRALLEACLERARRLGKRAVFLHSTPWMVAAHRLYLSSGFTREPGRDFLPMPDVPLLAFRRDIT